jgi:ABC-2 type transport system permease protein
MNVVLFISTYISFEYVKIKAYPIKTLLLIYVGFFLVEITFANLGLFLSVIIRKRKASTNISLGLVLGMYFLYTLSGVSDKLDVVKYITPFKYADATDIIAKGQINGSYVVIIVIINIVAVAATYSIYNRKDIPA